MDHNLNPIKSTTKCNVIFFYFNFQHKEGKVLNLCLDLSYLCVCGGVQCASMCVWSALSTKPFSIPDVLILCKLREQDLLRWAVNKKQPKGGMCGVAPHLWHTLPFHGSILDYISGLVFGILSTLVASKKYPNHCHQGVKEKLAWAEDQWL